MYACFIIDGLFSIVQTKKKIETRFYSLFFVINGSSGLCVVYCTIHFQREEPTAYLIQDY